MNARNALLIGIMVGLVAWSIGHGNAVKADGPPTCALTALPSVVAYGMPITLSWTSANAGYLSIDSGIGPVFPASSGSVQTVPSTSGTYTAFVQGPWGTARCSITITVQTSGFALTPAEWQRFYGTPTTTPPYPPYPPYPYNPPPPAPSAVLPLPYPGTTPAPLVLTVDKSGRVLIRGTVETAGSAAITLRSWGGLWTVRAGTFGPTTVTPPGYGGASDLSRLRPGDFVGALGTVSGVSPLTVDAYLVRDWTTNPVTPGDP